MSLAERVRAGLTQSAEGAPLDADEMFDFVVASHRRGRVRSRVVRQATAVAVVLTLFVGVAVLVSWRNAPVRYRSVRTITAPTTSRVGATTLKWSDPAQSHFHPRRARATLLAAHLAPDDPNVEFRATRTGKQTVALAATAPTARESAIVTDKSVSALTSFRRASARPQLLALLLNRRQQAKVLRHQLEGIDAKLAKMDPKVYGSVWKWDSQPRNDSSEPPAGTLPPVPERATVAGAQPRVRTDPTATRAREFGIGIERFGALAPTPIVIVEPTGRKAAIRVDTTPSTAAPLIGWGAEIGLIVAAAYVVYRRRSARVTPTQFTFDKPRLISTEKKEAPPRARRPTLRPGGDAG